MLYLVPTPIGNLKDITLRAIELLNEVDLILAEDTRVTGKLLKHFEIDTKMTSFHQHNEHRTVDRCIEQLKNGLQIALVSDAGTPGISDPGYLLVRDAVKEEIKVQCLPGPTAFVPALVVSGFPTDRFVFEGFLPQKKGRMKRLEALVNEERTIVMYESPHRIIKLLEQISAVLGEDRQVCTVREISKIYEESRKGTPAELITHFTDKGVKGEFVVLIAGK
jgi:16S rRNA (cytidine1402-2'-O)-methyltransferase